MYQTWRVGSEKLGATHSPTMLINSLGHLAHSDKACASSFLSGEGKWASESKITSRKVTGAL